MRGRFHCLSIFSGTANQPLAEEISKYLNIPLGLRTITRLPDSEIHVTIDDVVRGQDVFVIQPCALPVNDNFMELILMIDALRRASARDITAVVPYYPYQRQERMAKGRESISAKVISSMLERVGCHRIIFFDIHSPATQGFFDIPVDPLTALPVFCRYLEGQNLENAVIVSPDVGRAKFAGKYAEHLKIPMTIIHKRRTSFTTTEAIQLVGDIKGKRPIVIDDIVASGSIFSLVDTLIENGAEPEITFAITHGVLLPTALPSLDDPRIKKLLISNTVRPFPEVMTHPKIEVLSIGRLLADAIRRIHVGESISDLIERQ